MRDLHPLIQWALLSILFSLAIGGKPFFFPGGGKYLLERISRGATATTKYSDLEYAKRLHR
jgi:hypothetical protein